MLVRVGPALDDILAAHAYPPPIENLLAVVPDCPMALADQFGGEHLIRQALFEKGRRIKLEQRHKAESDIAVAAASVIARCLFLRELTVLGKTARHSLRSMASRASLS